MTEIKYQKHTKKTEKALEFWRQVVADYNSGMRAVDIADRYVNPNTGLNYTREHIYYILRRMRTL